MQERLERTAGAFLRRAREAAGLTLKALEQRSRGRFKPSAVGGYERGERTISLERFCELSRIYRVPADQLLGEILGAFKPEVRQELTIDQTRLDLVPGETGRRVAELIHQVKSRRGDNMSDVISLRATDLESLARATRMDPSALVDMLDPALISKK